MKLHHVGISVENLEESMRFYKEIFGFEKETVRDRPDLGGKQAILKREKKDLILELFDLEPKTDRKDDYLDLNTLGFKHISFQVDNIEKFYKMVKERGIETTELATGSTSKYFFLKDRDGNVLEIMQLV